MMKTGRAYFLIEMKKGAVLGSELSGHTYFGGDYFGYDDGIYSALSLLKALGSNNQSLLEIGKKLPKRAGTNELKIQVSDEEKIKIVDNVRAIIESSQEFIKILKIDGIRAYLSETGWFLVRSSGTSPYLSIRMEGKDKRELAQVGESLDRVLSKAHLTL